jgi:hypothetical protein
MSCHLVSIPTTNFFLAAVNSSSLTQREHMDRFRRACSRIASSILNATDVSRLKSTTSLHDCTPNTSAQSRKKSLYKGHSPPEITKLEYLVNFHFRPPVLGGSSFCTPRCFDICTVFSRQHLGAQMIINTSTSCLTHLYAS